MFTKDLLYAARSLAKSPVFLVTAVLTIALGIGASTAIFSVTNAVLLRSLPYKDPERLIIACGDMRKRNVKDFPFSNAEYFDLRDTDKNTFEDFAGVLTARGPVLREDGTPEQVRFGVVTPNFFRLLGAAIHIGRDFSETDGQAQPPQQQPGNNAPNAANAPQTPQLPTIAIISYEDWQRRFGGNTASLGQAVRTTGGGPSPQIVGVLAPRFELLFPPDAALERVPDIWIANRLSYDAANRNNVSLRIIGRLKPGVTLERAQIAADAYSRHEQSLDKILTTADWHVRLVPMQQHLVAEVRPAILALMGAVIFLLLIACSNVGNLLLVRASLRERELAVRTALGGSRWRLVRQMLAEALLLSSVGTVLGLALAWIGIHELLVIAPANLPRLDAIKIDPVVVAFTALAGLAAAAIFGIVPALRASRPDIMHVLRSSGRTAGLGGGRLLRNGVVIAEVALSFVLLIGSGLMFRSFLELQKINPGFDSHHLLTFQLLGGRAGRTPEQRAAFQRETRQALSSVGGVTSASAAFPFPLAGGFSPIRWGLEPALADPSKFQAADLQIVLPGYFETMRTRLLDGHTFTEADNAPDRKVAIIDQVLAAKAFPNQSAVGKRILTRAITPEPEWVQVIGVVGHQREESLATPGREQIYLVDGFFGHGAAGNWAVRTAGDPAKYGEAVRAAMAKIDPQSVITDLQPMDVLVDKAQAGTRFSLLLIGVFAVIAALLAGVGLYGVLATVVRQRSPEIGVRMALGAAPASVFRLMIGQGLRLSAAGIGLGLLAALGLTRVMISMLVGVKAADPLTYTAMVVIFLMIAALASWIPARRAATLDPTRALRDE
jgi:putative ABC transport system permease protein